MRRLPIRVRVTLAFSGVMAIVLLAVGLFLYFRLEAQLTRSVDQGLRSRATEVSALARERGDSRLGTSAVSPLIEQDEAFAEILTDSGQVLDASTQVNGAAVLSDAELARATTTPTFLETDEVPGVESPVRVLAVPLDLPSRHLVAVVGSSLGDRNDALDGLAKLLLIGGPAALLLASLAGYAMAAAALRPVESMRRRAATISADPGERLPVPEARDELARLGQTLNAMLGRLEEAMARERRFVDDASHELRTPLALHKTELELALLHAHGEDELRAAIASATDEIERLIALAEQLLVVARADDGGALVAPEPFEIEDVLSAIEARFSARTQRAGRSLSHAGPGEDVVLVAVRPEIEQALTNLVENALVHGAGAVRIDARTNGATVELHVTDEGEGIPEEFIERAFERFSRADVARAGGGTGLGLAVVESIAIAHGGSAHAANRPGGGADVWVALPLTPATRGRV